MESIVISAIKIIQDKPELIIGKRSIMLLNAFIAGVECADTKLWTTMPQYYFRGEFNKWVARKYKIEDSLGWDGIIFEQADNNDEKAFDLFFDLLDEYLLDDKIKNQFNMG
jgi:hypothetical protein